MLCEAQVSANVTRIARLTVAFDRPGVAVPQKAQLRPAIRNSENIAVRFAGPTNLTSLDRAFPIASVRLARTEAKAGRVVEFGRWRPDEHPLEQFENATNREVHNDLVMFHALAALNRAQVFHETEVTIAHPSQSTMPEHPSSMHRQVIQSNLDDNRFKRFA